MTVIYEVVFSKYFGETKLFAGKDSGDAMTNALAWAKKNKFGKEIKEFTLIGELAE